MSVTDMTKRARWALLGVALGAGTALAGSARPVLSVATTCATTAASAGGTVTVGIALAPGSAAVSGLDFSLTFDPERLTFQGIALADAVAALDGWERPATAPVVTPGRVQVLMAPKLHVPLPTFPAGTVAVVTFVVAADASPRCEAIGFAPDSVVFSTPPLGLAVAGDAADGGLEVRDVPPVTTTTLAGGTTTTTMVVTPPTEVCDDCVDNDGDGLVDFADPNCEATPLAVTKATVKAGKPQTSADDRVTVGASLPSPVSDLGSGIRIALGGEGTPLVCETLAANAFTTNRKRTSFTFKRGGTGVVLVRIKHKKGVARVTITVKGQEPSGIGQGLSVSIGIGAHRYHGSVALRAQGRKLVFP